MPQGCATWPAAWEVDEGDWPNEGEVDIVEGVNDQTPNQSTLHTSPGCTMPGSTTQTG
jgi:beta-glucanase (GH16 family)